jgi:hypothetical protein
VLSDPGPDLVQNNLTFGVLQFTVDEVQSVLLELDVSKGAGSNVKLPLILKNCAFAFGRLFFLTDLYRHVFLSTGGNFST